MAEESGEKTEEPSDKKLRDLREKGQVPKSQDVASTAVVLGVFAYVWIGWEFISDRVRAMVLLSMTQLPEPFEQSMPKVLIASGMEFVILSLPLLVMVIVLGMAGNLMQCGFMFSMESIKPDLNKINPKSWYDKTFSKKNAFEFFKNVVKLLVVLYISWDIASDAILEILQMPITGMDGVQVVLGMLMRRTAYILGGTFVAISAVDFLLQHHFFIKENMMTKEETKQEYKQMEGDPHIKGMRKQLHQEMVMSDTMEKVKKSDVLITNPTHIAVAIRYDEDEAPMPIIQAMGEGAIAHRMMKIAEEEGIPIMRNVALARELYDQGEVNNYIPSELIEPIAEVLVWLQEMKKSNQF